MDPAMLVSGVEYVSPSTYSRPWSMISRLNISKNAKSEIDMSNKKIRRIQIRYFINLLLDFTCHYQRREFAINSLKKYTSATTATNPINTLLTNGIPRLPMLGTGGGGGGLVGRVTAFLGKLGSSGRP